LAHLIISVLRWITNHFLSFVVILAVVAGGKWCYSEFRSAKAAHTRVIAIQEGQPELHSALLGASKQLDQQVQSIGRGGLGDSKAKLQIDGLIEQKTAERNAITSRSPFDGLPSVSDFQRLAVLDMEIAALKKISEGAGQLELLILAIADGKHQWAAKSKNHAGILVQWDRDANAKIAIRNNSWPTYLIPLTPAYNNIQQLTVNQIGLANQADALKDQIEKIKFVVDARELELKAAEKRIGIVSADVEGALHRADEKLANEVKRRSGSFFWAASESFWPAVRDQIPVALWILVGTILMPIGIKLLFYFVVAPWAARQPPIQILPLAGSATSTDALLSPDYVQSGKPSAVSLVIEVAPNEELLVHADYIQSSSATAGKTTKWLLDWGFPLTSLAAGLYALTRIAPRQAEAVVVSSTNDPLMEVAAIQIRAGSALVVQPRALVGVVQMRGSGIEITSHWRIGHLHSWLTLQFRYLAFHGPCRLIIKGCRGVRVEPAVGGRLVNQAATLGFSANSLYSVSRCETFVSYWRGIEELFNDQFQGADAIYLYEEMPGLHRKAGITGRGLEGFTDSVLKVFGV
jgi:hypothetical protein